MARSLQIEESRTGLGNLGSTIEYLVAAAGLRDRVCTLLRGGNKSKAIDLITTLGVSRSDAQAAITRICKDVSSSSSAPPPPPSEEKTPWYGRTEVLIGAGVGAAGLLWLALRR